ncbi:MAG: hypothetical protein AAF741_15610 [Bacteroidota bacterium]
MGILLKLVGGLGAAYYLFGDKVTAAVASRIEYRIDDIKLRDLKIDILPLRGILTMRLYLKQSLGINLSVQSFFIQFWQGSTILGTVNSQDESITLNHGETKTIELQLTVKPGDFLNRLEAILKNPSRVIAPLDIKGVIYFSNDQSIEIVRQVKILSV